MSNLDPIWAPGVRLAHGRENMNLKSIVPDRGPERPKVLHDLIAVASVLHLRQRVAGPALNYVLLGRRRRASYRWPMRPR